MLLDLVVMAVPIPIYFEQGARGRTRLGLVGIIAMGTVIPVFWGPMMTSASHLLGQIFVTKEVQVTTEHRFGNLGSSDAFHQHEGPWADLEDGKAYLEQRCGSRVEWTGKDGAQHHSTTWTA
ncbi:predicted protein [Chaetomium globosum CBS 148.51]|uniref:Uncharacterized protein n=1 Tax=Chaetomium globosum (strain ATCC 6205 / CBS 148.51 / DSM 1962 / NBRC 6347 / NRRL 1970) TaxID=306901 RepID=Q2HID1_CHAGB|nr:uncharacterized protein CHGG_00023 [Chaetomium globosum CBS 148.51]EAQ91788.1 predicted protein [Chaetomium globosum CBS 148.51]